MLQFPLGVLSFDVCKCTPCCEDRPGRMGRTCLWRSFGRQLCVRICRCHIQVVKMRGRDRWLFLKYFLVLSQFKLEMIQFDWLISFSCWVVQPPRRHFVASLSPANFPYSVPGEVLPDAEAESLGSGRDAWPGDGKVEGVVLMFWWWFMGPEKQMNFCTKGCEKRCLRR